MSSREQLLRHALAGVIEVDAQEVSLTLPFAEQGVDSLVGLRFARQIQDLLDTEVELEWMFDHPTIRQLSEFLDKQFGHLEAEPTSPACEA